MRRTNRTLSALLVVGLVLAATLVVFAGCGPVYVEEKVVYAPDPPPPPRIEVVAERPGPRYVWVPGSWEWRAKANRYRWLPGRWRPIRHPHHNQWVPGYWTRTPHGYHWVPGRWR